MDQQVCEAVKRLNALRHQKNTREKKLQQLQTEYNQLVTNAEVVSNTDAGESAEAQVKKKIIIVKDSKIITFYLLKMQEASDCPYCSWVIFDSKATFDPKHLSVIKAKWLSDLFVIVYNFKNEETEFEGCSHQRVLVI